MIFKITYTLILSMLFVTLIHSQNFDRLDIPVTSGQKTLKLPLTGGLKAGQFSNIDFNDDGSGGNPFYGKTKHVLYFPTALTDEELEALTQV